MYKEDKLIIWLGTLEPTGVIVSTPSPFCWLGVGGGGGGEWNLQPNFQKRGLKGPQLLKGDCWERGGEFFRGGGGGGGVILPDFLPYLETNR